MRLCATLIYLLVTAGCYRDPDLAGEIQIDSVLRKLVSGDERTTFVHAGKFGIVVTGLLRAPCQPYEANAVAERAGAAVQLTVIGQNVGDCQPTRSGNVGYEGVLCVPPGSYRLLVIHAWTDTSWPRERIAEFAIEVPENGKEALRPVCKSA